MANNTPENLYDNPIIPEEQPKQADEQAPQVKSEPIVTTVPETELAEEVAKAEEIPASPQTEQALPTDEIPSMTRFKKLATILVLSLALAIIILDTTLLNVSLATIIQDFKTDIQSIQWVITAYSLTLAALTITGGRLGDLFGRKRMFVVGAFIFAIGSFIASVSQNVPQMILGESIVEGIGAALMMPATASILVSNFKGRDRALAFGIWGGVAGASAALGPILGGFLTTYYSWRWGFRINVFVALLLFAGSFILNETRDDKEKPTIDWLGVLLSSIGLLSFVFGLIESSVYGWWNAKKAFEIGSFSFASLFGSISVVPFALGIGIMFLLLFFAWEMVKEERGETPLVSTKLFSNRQFLTGALTTLVISLGQSGIIFSIPVFLQAVQGYDALQTGISLLPMSLTLLIVSPLGAVLSGKIRPKVMIMAGLLLNALAMLVLWAVLSVDATASAFIPGLAMMGMGMGLVMSQINNITLSAVPVYQAGEASGVNNTFRQIGSSFGSAIIGAILLSSLSTNLVNGINNSTIIPNEAKSQIANRISDQTSNVEFGGGAAFATQIPPVIKDEITSISHHATVDANRSALLVSSLFGFLGFALSFLLPNVSKIGKGGPSGGH